MHKNAYFLGVILQNFPEGMPPDP